MEGILDETFDRIVNCPLCGGSLESWYYKYTTDINGFRLHEAYINRYDQENGTEYNYRRVGCPLCDGTGTALARVIGGTQQCRQCDGRGSVETTVKLEVGAQKRKSTCTACGGKGTMAQERIEIQTFQTPSKSCYIYFEDKLCYPSNGRIVVDLEGAAKAFFSKWQPASQSTYLLEKRKEAQHARHQEELRQQEEMQKRQLVQERIRQGLCAGCGGALGILDQMAGRKRHKRCN